MREKKQYQQQNAKQEIQETQSSQEQKESGVLTFQEFIERDSNDLPRFNNFFLYFLEGNPYRSFSHFVTFYKDHPELVDELTEKIVKAIRQNPGVSQKEVLKTYEQDMYKMSLVSR